MQVKPFPFDCLEDIPRHDMQLINGLLSATGYGGLESMAEVVTEAMEPLLSRWRIDFAGPAVGRHVDVTANDFVARLTLTDGTPFFVIFDTQLVEGLLKELLKDRIPRAGTPVNDADFGALIFILLNALPSLRSVGMPACVVDTVRPHPESLRTLQAREDSVGLRWFVSKDIWAGCMQILGPAAAFRRAVVPRPVALDHVLGDITQAVPVYLERQLLSEEEYQGLSIGDILFMGKTHVEAPWVARLRLNTLWVGGLLLADETTFRFQVSDPFDFQKEGNMQENEQDVTSMLHVAEVNADVLVGSAKMSLETLARLQAGSIIELNARVGDPVQLQVNGQTFGRGELVNVDGRLGVRVLSRLRR